MDRSIIDQYESGADLLKSAVAGVSPEEMQRVPTPDAGVGKWSIQQIIIHLMDSDLIYGARMKSIIAEDHPKMLGFDEAKFAANLCYDKQDPATAMRIMDLYRRQFAKMLHKLPDSAFARTGEHEERGTISLEQCIGYMIQHIPHHVKFIEAKRKLSHGR